jgi:hypothetical protein
MFTSGSEAYKGWLDDIRITKGVARYTADFTPPTEAFADAAPTTYDPFFDNVQLLLHCNGTDGSTTFTDVKGHTVTPVGNAQIDTAQSKFDGASYLGDGSGDYLSITDAGYIEGNDYTAEFWVRGNNAAARGLFSCGSAPWHTTIGLDGGGKIDVRLWTGSATIGITGTTTVYTGGSWHHIALVQSGSTLTLYVNGVREGTPITSGLPSVSTDLFRFGAGISYWTGSHNGWLDDIRFTKGIARYTTNFTPPTAAFPDTGTEPSSSTTYTITSSAGAELIAAVATTYTVTSGADSSLDNPPQSELWPYVDFLFHFNGANDSVDIYDEKGHGILGVGNIVKLTTGQYKWGGASLRLPGNAGLIVEDTIGIQEGSTLEGWFKREINGLDQVLYSNYEALLSIEERALYPTAAAFTLQVDADGHITLYHKDLASAEYDAIIIRSDTVISDYSWHHFAVTGASYIQESGYTANQYHMHIDGVHQTQYDYEHTAYEYIGTSLGTKLYIGCQGDDVNGTKHFKGWIDDFRRGPEAYLMRPSNNFIYPLPTEEFFDGKSYVRPTSDAVLAATASKVTYSGAALQKAGFTKTTGVSQVLSGTAKKTPLIDACLGLVRSKVAFAGPAELGVQKELTSSCDFLVEGTEYVTPSALMLKAMSMSSSANGYVSLVGLTKTVTAGAVYSTNRRVFANSAVFGSVYKTVQAGCLIQATQEITLSGSISSVTVDDVVKSVHAGAYLQGAVGLTATVSASFMKQRVRTVTANVYLAAPGEIDALGDSLLLQAALKTVTSGGALLKTIAIQPSTSSLSTKEGMTQTMTADSVLRAYREPATLFAYDCEWNAAPRQTEWTADERNTEWMADARGTEWISSYDGSGGSVTVTGRASLTAGAYLEAA